jgi:hypothetical protein
MDFIRSLFGTRPATVSRRNNQRVNRPPQANSHPTLKRSMGFRRLNIVPNTAPEAAVLPAAALAVNIPVVPRRGLRRTGAFRGINTIQTGNNSLKRVGPIQVDLESLLNAFPRSGYTPPEGFSVQIHRAFSKINKSALFSFLLDRTGPITIPAATDSEYSDYILSTLQGFLDKMENSNNRKNTAITDLANIYTNMLKRMKFSVIYRQIISLCLEYVKLQPEDFQKAYVYFYALDCAHAYNGKNGMSCALGILERFVSSLASAAAVYIESPLYTEKGYDRLVSILENSVKTLRKRIEDSGAACFQQHGEDETEFRECIKRRLREELGTSYNNSAASTELNAYIPVLGVFGGGRRTRKLKRKSRM